MTFKSNTSFFHPSIGNPVSLSRGHIDLPTLVLTFHYKEWVDNGPQWNWEPRQQALTLHQHYRIDKRRGMMELLDDPLWNQVGLWAAGDRSEPLLYKGQIKHSRGQYIGFSYDYFIPEEVDDPSSVDLTEVDVPASTRLGYDVLRYSGAPKESMVSAPWNWEKEP